MSEVKRFSANYIPGHPPAIVTDPNGLLCLYSELDVERLAHAETKLAYDVLSDEFSEMESDLKDEIKDLKKRLAELEDALFTNKEMMGDDAGWFIKVQDWQPGYKEINDAIKNVKERRK